MADIMSIIVLLRINKCDFLDVLIWVGDVCDIVEVVASQQLHNLKKILKASHFWVIQERAYFYWKVLNKPMHTEIEYRIWLHDIRCGINPENLQEEAIRYCRDPVTHHSQVQNCTKWNWCVFIVRTFVNYPLRHRSFFFLLPWTQAESGLSHTQYRW